MEEKTCKYCQKQISSYAVKCPHCQEWLNKTALNWKNPYFIPGIVIISGLTLAEVLPNRLLKRHKSLFVDPITYKVGHRLILQNESLIKDKTAYRIIGEIHNNEPYFWDRVEILAVFNDKNDKPLYLSTAYVHDLKPGEKRLFQVNSPCSDEGVSFENFKDFKIQIETASGKLIADKK